MFLRSSSVSETITVVLYLSEYCVSHGLQSLKCSMLPGHTSPTHSGQDLQLSYLTFPEPQSPLLLNGKNAFCP